MQCPALLCTSAKRLNDETTLIELWNRSLAGAEKLYDTLVHNCLPMVCSVFLNRFCKQGTNIHPTFQSRRIWMESNLCRPQKWTYKMASSIIVVRLRNLLQRSSKTLSCWCFFSWLALTCDRGRTLAKHLLLLTIHHFEIAERFVVAAKHRTNAVQHYILQWDFSSQLRKTNLRILIFAILFFIQQHNGYCDSYLLTLSAD